MKTKVSELTGSALDWAVALAEGGTHFWSDGVATHWIKLRGEDRALSDGWAQSYLPTTDWVQGGPIIEREMISVWPWDDVTWKAEAARDAIVFEGKTPLIAAMRCYVASKLGDTVTIPVELQ